MPQDPLRKGLPQNLDAERLLLGWGLTTPEAPAQLMALLPVEDLAQESHRRIYLRMQEIHQRGLTPDRVLLVQELQKHGQLEAVGGIPYLLSLDDGLAQLMSPEGYIRTVREAAVLRRTIFACQSMIDRCLLQHDPAEMAPEAEKMLTALSSVQQPSGHALKHVSQVVLEAGGLNALFSAKRGIETPWRQLNDLTAGLHPGQLIVIAGRPGKGKTSLACQIVEHVARLNVGACAVFSLEMAASSILTRMACAKAAVSNSRIRAGRIEREERNALSAAIADMSETPLYFADGMVVNVPAIHAALRGLKTKSRLALVCVDYLQLMTGLGKQENRTQEVSAISRGLKMAAAELQVPLIVLSQFSREAAREGKPQLHHLRESGSIEQDADWVGLIHEPDGVDFSAAGWRVQLLIEKQREGPMGEVNLWFDKTHTRFLEQQ